MPVILEPKDYDRWLDPGDPARPPVDLLHPYTSECMKVWPVIDCVGKSRPPPDSGFTDNAGLRG
jgi:putative SOS response-associated peptidase YedK